MENALGLMLPHDKVCSVLRTVEQIVDTEIKGGNGGIQKLTRYAHRARTTLDEIQAAPAGNSIGSRGVGAELPAAEPEPTPEPKRVIVRSPW